MGFSLQLLPLDTRQGNRLGAEGPSLTSGVPHAHPQQVPTVSPPRPSAQPAVG